ncbi:MAG: protein tyrosine kinase [Pseudomonadota bacterium]
MEKIKRALERAERNRLAEKRAQTERPDAVADVATHTTETIEEAANSAVDAQPIHRSQTLAPATTRAELPTIESRKIEFTQTRRVVVDSKVLERNRLLQPGSGGDVERAYDLLASRVIEKIRNTGWNSIALVSPASGEGKTVTGINLAMQIAASPERTALLVDMDFRRPSVASYLGLNIETGVEDVLRGTASVAEALVCPSIDRFCVLPAREPSNRTADLIDSVHARSLALELRNRYANRVVLFDLPPLLAYGDALTFLANVDAVIVVVTEGVTTQESMLACMNELKGQNVIGSVLNRTTDLAAGY